MTASIEADPLGPVTTSGGTFATENVTVSVPAGAITTDDRANVLAGPPPDAAITTNEVFGPVVGLEHDHPVNAPIEVRWDISGLDQTARDTIVLTRWSEELAVWMTDPGALSVPHRVEGDTLFAEIDEWSFWSWIADSGQDAGERTGTRVDAPDCSGEALPGWVLGTVDPDEGTTAAALRACFEPDNDDRVTVRLANNRTFTQRIKRTDSDETFAWTWTGERDLSITGALFDTARVVFDDDETFLLPPLHEVALGFGRPVGGGEYFIRFEADVDPVTVLIDISDAALSSIPPGGFDNRVVNAFIEALYRCAGDRLLSSGELSGEALARAVLGSLVDCAGLIIERDNEFGALYEEVALRSVNEGSGVSRAIFERSNRFAVKAATSFKLLQLGEIAFYLSDQFANALVGNLGFGIRARGEAGAPGGWTPTCNDVTADREAWSRAWVTQDVFNTPPLRDFHEYAEFESILTEATRPLASCPEDHRRAVREAILSSGFNTTETAEIAERILDAIVSGVDQTADGGNDICAAEAIARDLGKDTAAITVEGCEEGWALVDQGGQGDTQLLAEYTDGRWDPKIYFPSPLCRSEALDQGVPTSLVDRYSWLCRSNEVPEQDPHPIAMSAEVPALCSNQAGRLVNGALPDELTEAPWSPDGEPGFTYLVDEPLSVRFDLDGNGSDEIIGVVVCVYAAPSGIIPDGETIVIAWDPAGNILHSFDLWEIAESRTVITSLTPTSEGFRIDFDVCTPGVRACVDTVPRVAIIDQQLVLRATDRLDNAPGALPPCTQDKEGELATDPNDAAGTPYICSNGVWEPGF